MNDDRCVRGRRLFRAGCPALIVAAVLVAASPRAARAQVYSPYFPSPLFQYGAIGYALPLPVMNWPSFYFPAINFGTVNFGVWNWYPVNGYYGYDPYWYYAALAQGEFQAMSDYGLSQGYYNLQTMASSSLSDANSMVANSLAEIYQARAADNAQHSDRFNIVTGRAWSTGRSGSARITDLTSRTGDVLWPIYSPVEGDLRDKRAHANEAVKSALSDFRRNGKASVATLSQALRALAAYANPAVETLREQAPDDVHGFITFVRDLDTSLRNLAGEVDARKLPRPRVQADEDRRNGDR